MKRRIVISSLVAVMVAASAYAAAAHGPGYGPGFGGKGDPGRHLERMARVLDLTAAQKEKAGAIIKAEREKTQALRQQLADGHEQFRQLILSDKFDEAAVKALANKQSQIRAELMVSHAKAGSEIYGLLTSEQRTLAQKFEPLMGPGHGGGMRCWDTE